MKTRVFYRESVFFLPPTSPSAIGQVSRQAPLRHGPGRSAASPRVQLSLLAIPVHAGGVCFKSMFRVCVCVCVPSVCVCLCVAMICVCYDYVL